MTPKTSSSGRSAEVVSEDQKHSGSEGAGDAIIKIDGYMPTPTKISNINAVESVQAIDEIKSTITTPCKQVLNQSLPSVPLPKRKSMTSK